MSEILLNQINILLENKGKPQVKILKNEDRLRDDLGFDSLDLAELTVRIESEFGIDIFDDGIVNTIGEIMQKLSSKSD